MLYLAESSQNVTLKSPGRAMSPVSQRAWLTVRARNQSTGQGHGKLPLPLHGCGLALVGTSMATSPWPLALPLGLHAAPGLRACALHLGFPSGLTATAGGRPLRLTTFPFGPGWPSMPVTPWMALEEKGKKRRQNAEESTALTGKIPLNSTRRPALAVPSDGEPTGDGQGVS